MAMIVSGVTEQRNEAMIVNVLCGRRVLARIPL